MDIELTLWTMVLAVATIALALATSLLVFFASKELRRNERNTRFNVYKSVMDMLEVTKDEREKINKAINLKKSEKVKSSDYDKIEYEIIIRHWDQLAYLVKLKVVPKDFVLDYYSLPIVTSWVFLFPIIENERREQNRPNYRKKFEDLAKEADKWRVINGKQDKKLITENHE